MIDSVLLTAGLTHHGALDALLEWANVTTAAQLAIVLFGLVAQSMFFLRWIVQWIASERRQDSHIPEVFWWISLLGATTMLLYFYLRGEPVGLLGQSVGWLVYLRNLHLVRRRRRETAQPAEPHHEGPAEPELSTRWRT